MKVKHPNEYPTLYEKDLFNLRIGIYKGSKEAKMMGDYTCILCGTIASAPLCHVRRGQYKATCGCYKKNYRVTKKKEYKAWAHVVQRCTNPNESHYHNYGGRGIKVCDRWRESFENFLEDMGDCPSKLHSIERVNVNGDYTKDNCIWMLFKDQGRNTTKTVRIKVEGKSFVLLNMCEEIGFKFVTLYHRIQYTKKYDYTLEEVIHLFRPIRVLKNHKKKHDKEYKRISKEDIGKNVIDFVKINS